LPPPPVIVPPPPPVIVPPPPPVIVPPLPVADVNKIDPALLDLMQANPLALLPVIVEMEHPLPPFVGAPNVGRAMEALGLLRAFGVPVAELSLIDGAAGFANAAGIDAISLTPSVAFIHHDATVVPRRSADRPVAAPPGQPSEAYSRVVNADQVWQQGIHGTGVTVAVLDSGVAADADLVQPANRILASVNFADERLTSDPGGHGTHIAGIIAGNGSRSGGEIIGIAPQANVVDVRVLGNTGAVGSPPWCVGSSGFSRTATTTTSASSISPLARVPSFPTASTRCRRPWKSPGAAVSSSWPRRGTADRKAAPSKRQASTRTSSPLARRTIAEPSAEATTCSPGSPPGAAPTRMPSPIWSHQGGALSPCACRGAPWIRCSPSASWWRRTDRRTSASPER